MSSISKINVNGEVRELSSGSSGNSDIIIQNYDSGDFNIGDENGNVLVQFKDGHIKTKNFDSCNYNKTHLSKLRFLQWNIAYFNLGPGTTNAINTFEKYNQYLPVYRKLFNEVNADIISLCEYTTPFLTIQPQYTTKRELFPNYKYYYDSQNPSGGSGIGLFSHIPISNIKDVPFVIAPSYRYYRVCDIQINGKKIKFVGTHLTHKIDSDGKNNTSAAQIQQLIEDFKDEEYVIILADFNIGIDGFKPFKDAGYTLANHGYNGNLITYYDVQDVYDRGMDNIIVKGGSINFVNTIDPNNRGNGIISDHWLIYCDIVFE